MLLGHHASLRIPVGTLLVLCGGCTIRRQYDHCAGVLLSLLVFNWFITSKLVIKRMHIIEMSNSEGSVIFSEGVLRGGTGNLQRIQHRSVWFT